MEPRLPISVIVPLSKGRYDFFHEKCLPSIIENCPEETIIEQFEGGACEKRNLGRQKATQPYLFFCDDDTVLAPDCLSILVEVLESASPDTAYAYGHYRIKKNGGSHPLKDGGIVKAKPFSADALRNRNFVSTMSLFREEPFPLWDEELPSFHDWDVALSLLRDGFCGEFVDKVLFEAWYIDRGISATANYEVSLNYIKQKHGL